LQKRMKEWDVNQLTGITLTTSPREHIWSEETYTLECADGIIALTRPQALIVSDWFRTRAETYMSSKKEQANERDTHFAGFAKLVAEELPDPPIDDSYLGLPTAEWKETIQKIIARRAYDLVFHTLMEVDPAWLDMLDTSEWTGRIPDMTEWPKS